MKKIFVTIFAALALVGCEEAFDVESTGSLSGSAAAEMVEQDPSFLTSYVNGIYSYFVQYNTAGSTSTNHDDYGLLATHAMLEIMCEDIAVCGTLNWGSFDIPHGYGAAEYAHTYILWNFYFTTIAKANEIINFFGEDDPQNPILRGYLGQAYAARALSYMYLMQIYQDPVTGTTPNAVFRDDAPGVPIIYAVRDGKSVEEMDAKGGRNTLKDIKEEVERNLALATPLLEGYERGSKNEIDATVLNGIAARYYLLTQQWDKAEAAAHAAQTGYTVLPKDQVVSNGFMEVSDPEVMWGFNHSTETMTSYASFFSHVSNDSPGYGGRGQSVHCINKALYDKIPSSDTRKSLFNGPEGDAAAAQAGARLPYASRKFGYMASWLQDYLYMRVEEMILIEAEAQARQNNNSGAAATLKKLMAERDASWAEASVSVDDVLLQRKIELWCEGFEYFDIRRNGLGATRDYDGSNHPAANKKNYPAHDLSWNFQVPLREIQNNVHISEDEKGDYVDPTA